MGQGSNLVKIGDKEIYYPEKPKTPPMKSHTVIMLV
jgi:hypothetical protein